jgi:predicted HicB family RNase H-like nuclease
MEVTMSAIQARKGGDTVSTTLRMPKSLRNRLKIEAITQGRSLNTHLIMILTEGEGQRQPSEEASQKA